MCPTILRFFILHGFHYCNGRRDQLLTSNYCVWRISANRNQHIFHGGVTGFFEDRIPNIRNGTFSGTWYVPGATLFVDLSVPMPSLSMSQLRDVTTITGDSVLAGIVSFLPFKSLHVFVLQDQTPCVIVCLLPLTDFSLCPRCEFVLNVSAWPCCPWEYSFDARVNVWGAQ